MREYELYTNKSMRKSKSEIRLDYEYLNLIEEQPYTTYLELLKEEVDNIDIEDAVNNPFEKSYSLCNLYAMEENFDDFLGDI